MAKLPRWSYWGRFATLATASLCLLFFFVFGFLPQRFLLELDFSESGFAYPVIRPPLPVPPPPPPAQVRRPIARGPGERFWAEYVPLVGSGQHDAALELVARYLDRYPNDLGARLEYARELWRAGRLNDAIDAYHDALALGAEPGVRLELARLYSAAGEWDSALAMYEVLAEESPRDRELLREFAEVATWAERYDHAEGVYARLGELAPGDPELRLQWARVLYWSDRPERAHEVLAHLPPEYRSAGVDSLRAAIAVALPPPDAEPSLLERARGLAMAGAADSALALYRVILLEDSGADSTLVEMADVFEYRANEPDSAIAYLCAYLDRRPGDRDVRMRLARLLVWNGFLAEAEAETEEMVALRPDDAEAWALLGDLRRWSGDYWATCAAGVGIVWGRRRPISSRSTSPRKRSRLLKASPPSMLRSTRSWRGWAPSARRAAPTSSPTPTASRSPLGAEPGRAVARGYGPASKLRSRSSPATSRRVDGPM
jgi:Flp pilus assembly protein TadD